jgi:hypothetical protein
VWNSTPKCHTYTPQQNGFVERMNKMLMDKERSMPNGDGITKELWAEEFKTARYLVNMSPSSILVDTTPNEVWSGKNPWVAHLKVFG